MALRDIFTYVAKQIFFDNSTNGFISEDVQGAIEEVNNSVQTSASPGFGFGRSGNVPSNTWLYRTGNVPSNKTGVAMGITNPIVIQVDVGNENISTFDIQVYEHEGDEVNLTLLGTVSVVASRTGSFTVSWAATSGRQLAVKLSDGSAKNPGVDITLSGTN